MKMLHVRSCSSLVLNIKRHKNIMGLAIDTQNVEIFTYYKLNKKSLQFYEIDAGFISN